MLKKISVYFFISLIIFSFSTNVFAFNTFPNNPKLIGGVGNYGANNRYYYITPSASGLTSLISNAVSSWVYTTTRLGITTPISISRTYTQSSSVFDVYYVPFSNDTLTLGLTDFYSNSTMINPPDGAPPTNWGWSKIRLNSNSLYKISTNNQQGTIAHEFGHGMGLAHVSYQFSIMCQYYNNRFVYLPGSDDLYGINFLYQ